MTKTVLTYCSECDGEKNHKKLFSKIAKGYSKGTEEFSIVECMGCNAISFLQTIKLSKKSKPMHFNYPDDQNPAYYNFLSEKHVAIFPKSIRKLYDELIPAFEGGSTILLGIGLRALVEAICIDQSIPGSNLLKKIEKLHDEGLISKSELPILDKLRIIGNDSAHKVKGLSMYKLELALGIVNHVLTSIYILPVIIKKLDI
ncbi:MAG TPA: DUF4145 domain-containing protein [Cyclobacteriaceae bacterium]|nr:DUF4145 domain-containing protein [Cyclobacteriaceae bacterium]